MKKFCVIGNPIGHSKSPSIFEYIFKTLNIRAKYYTQKIEDYNTFNEFIFKNKSIYSGFNITAPFKKQAYKIVDEVHSSACDIEAVNCIKINNGKLIGYNTDIFGFKMMVENQSLNINNKNFLILGNGASAKMVCLVLHSSYPKEISILGRNIKNVKNFIHDFNQTKFTSNSIREYKKGGNIPYILINCLPVNIDENSSNNILSYIPVSNIELVVDLNYVNSKLIEKLKLLNCSIQTGYDMLLFQAIKSFEIWFEDYCGKIKYDIIKNNIINE